MSQRLVRETPPLVGPYVETTAVMTKYNPFFERAGLKKIAESQPVKEAFVENKHPRFMKEFSFHDPYGKSKFYKETVQNADTEKLTKLTGICSILLQTKAYPLWYYAWNFHPTNVRLTVNGYAN